MPSIAEKHDCLGGQVFRYGASAKGWFYRRYDASTRSYRTGKVEGATTLEEALRDAYKTLERFNQPKGTKPRKQQASSASQSSLAELVDEFHKWETKRVEAGLKDELSAYKRRVPMRVMLSYLKLKGIEYPSEINNLTFDDYVLFRQGKRKATIKDEIKHIRVFFGFLQPRGHITNELIMDRNFLPRIALKDEDLDANPAITPPDYKLINHFIRNEWIPQATNHNARYTRQLMWTYIHLLKNSGCRPNEMLSLRRRDIEITNEPRWSESKQEWETTYKLKLFIRKSKTGKRRDVLCRSNAGERLLKFLKFQNSYLSTHYERVEPDENSLIFGKPEEFLEKGYCYKHISTQFRNITRAVNTKGNRYSERPYTLYSLRSTFIEDCIADGLDVYIVARLCGNSVNVIQKHYDRHDVLKRAQEVQALPIGRTKPPEIETIDPMKL